MSSPSVTGAAAGQHLTSRQVGAVDGPSGVFVDDPAPVVVRPEWRLTLRTCRLLSLALLALGLAVGFGDAWLVGLAVAPVLLLLAPVVAAARSGDESSRLARHAEVRVSAPSRRTFEGETFEVRLRVRSDTRIGWIDATATPGLGVESQGARCVGSTVIVTFSAPRWGRWWLGTAELYLNDVAGLLRAAVMVPLGDVAVYPNATDGTLTPTPVRLPDWIGEHTARVAGDGVEFFGVRPYVWGDRQRRVNWPATTRRGRLQVNQFAAERAADTVVMIDAYSDVGEAGRSTLDAAVRGAAGLARTYLKLHDRVGVISVGGRLRWLTAGSGSSRLYRIVETVLDVRRDFGFSGTTLDRMPRQALPSHAVVYVLSPLLSVHMLEIIRDLWERGLTLVVIEIDCPAPQPRPGDLTDDLAVRLWRLDRASLRFSLSQLGIPAARWSGDGTLDLALAAHTRRPLRGRSR